MKFCTTALRQLKTYGRVLSSKAVWREFLYTLPLTFPKGNIFHSHSTMIETKKEINTGTVVVTKIRTLFGFQFFHWYLFCPRV